VYALPSLLQINMAVCSPLVIIDCERSALTSMILTRLHVFGINILIGGVWEKFYKLFYK
jgi:hypothetical protein